MGMKKPVLRRAQVWAFIFVKKSPLTIMHRLQFRIIIRWNNF